MKILQYPAHIANLARKGVIAVTHLFRRWRRVRKFRKTFPAPPSILSNDCAGGVMAHELGLPFCSPTVNLFFNSPGEFVDYVMHLAYYTSVPIEPCGVGDDGTRRYPMGVLRGDGVRPDVKIHFLHYRSFDEVQISWERRTRRINPDAVCVVMHIVRPERELLERFAQLPYARKVVLTYEPYDAPFVYPMREPGGFKSGKLLRFKGLGGRRYLDEFDYAAFLCDGTIRSVGPIE